MKISSSKLLVLVLTLVFAVTVFGQQYSYDYKVMKMDEYRAELAKWQKRLADAETAIASEESKISDLKKQISGIDNDIAQTYKDMYALLGTDEAGYKAYLDQAKALESDVSGFSALSAQDMYSRRNELDNYKNRLAELRKDKKSLGYETYSALSRVEDMIKQADEKMRSAVIMYSVVRGDYLWRIAKKPDIYSDPYAWIRIYTANRDQIKNPDLIYPNQVFRVPKLPAPNEHWVTRGEDLSKIAGSPQVYGNPFKWQKIYEANKGVISDPNLIYPNMILNIPQN